MTYSHTIMIKTHGLSYFQIQKGPYVTCSLHYFNMKYNLNVLDRIIHLEMSVFSFFKKHLHHLLLTSNF